MVSLLSNGYHRFPFASGHTVTPGWPGSHSRGTQCPEDTYVGPELHCFILHPSEGLTLPLCPAGRSVRPFPFVLCSVICGLLAHKHCSLHHAIARDAAPFTWWRSVRSPSVQLDAAHRWGRAVAGSCFSCQLEALWAFSQSVVLPEEAPRLRGKRDKNHARAWFCSGHPATRAAGGQPGRALPGETSGRDQRTWPCVWRGLCRGTVNRCAGQVLGMQRCRDALPGVGPAAPGVAVPSGRLDAPSVGLWEGGVFSECLPACLLSGRSHLPRPGLRPSRSHLGIGPSVGSCWTPPTHTHTYCAPSLCHPVIVSKSTPPQTSCSPWGHRCPAPGEYIHPASPQS